MNTRRFGFPIVLTLALLAPLGALAQASTTGAAAGTGSTSSVSITGTISSIKGLTFVVDLGDGTSKTVTLRSDAVVLDRQPATPDQIKAGDGVGVAATKDKDALTATRITIFSPAMWDGIRKGQSSMADGEIMTNAMTAQVMKNAQGRVLTLRLEMGSAVITVPDSVTVLRLVAVRPDQLTVGLKVTFRGVAASDGSLAATSASFDQPAKG